MYIDEWDEYWWNIRFVYSNLQRIKKDTDFVLVFILRRDKEGKNII